VTNSAVTITDKRIKAVISKLHESRQRPSTSPFDTEGPPDPHHYAEYGFSIWPEQGDLIYLLCRAMRAKRVAEFATSIGMSTMYFAAAMKDNGGGIVIGSELVKEKVETARANLTEAGLEKFADIRPGDARKTLADMGGDIDFMLFDGWPLLEGPSLSLQVLRIAAPQIRIGGLLMNDNGEEDYLEYVRNPANGFRTLTLPLKGETELSVKVG
jgi:predicted O-methyltransferase YrrM